MQNEPPAELVEIAARFILGPREPVPPSAKYTLAELQQVYWDQSSGQERKEALWVARAVLAAASPQIEARVVGEIVAWLRERSGTYHGRMYGECCPNKRRHLSERSCSLSDIANALARGDYKESQP